MIHVNNRYTYTHIYIHILHWICNGLCVCCFSAHICRHKWLHLQTQSECSPVQYSRKSNAWQSLNKREETTSNRGAAAPCAKCAAIPPPSLLGVGTPVAFSSLVKRQSTNNDKQQTTTTNEQT